MKGRADSGALNTRQLAVTSGENDAGFFKLSLLQDYFRCSEYSLDSGIGTFSLQRSYNSLQRVFSGLHSFLFLVVARIVLTTAKDFRFPLFFEFSKFFFGGKLAATTLCSEQPLALLLCLDTLF